MFTFNTKNDKFAQHYVLFHSDPKKLQLQMEEGKYLQMMFKQQRNMEIKQ